MHDEEEYVLLDEREPPVIRNSQGSENGGRYGGRDVEEDVCPRYFSRRQRPDRLLNRGVNSRVDEKLRAMHERGEEPQYLALDEKVGEEETDDADCKENELEDDSSYDSKTGRRDAQEDIDLPTEGLADEEESLRSNKD